MLSIQTNSSLSWNDQLKQESFSWAVFQFVLQAKEHSFLPEYKGSTLRGGFGHSFRRVCCTVQNQECKTCILNKNCPYAYIFETPKVNGMNVQHQADNLPHPFVIEPPETEQTEFHPGEELSVGLVLFGKSISFLPYFVYTFDQMGRMGLGQRRGRFELKTVYAFDNLLNQSRLQIYDNQTQILNGNFKNWQLEDVLSNFPVSNPDAIKLHFLTPSRVLQKNKLVNRIPFELFIRTLLRRISLLGKIHCESSWDLPYQDIITQAAQNVQLQESETDWYSWERYSNRQKKRMNMGGIIGTIAYQGEIKPFLPLIYLGQFTHIGKNTTFGLGKYVAISN